MVSNLRAVCRKWEINSYSFDSRILSYMGISDLIKEFEIQVSSVLKLVRTVIECRKGKSQESDMQFLEKSLDENEASVKSLISVSEKRYAELSSGQEKKKIEFENTWAEAVFLRRLLKIYDEKQNNCNEIQEENRGINPRNNPTIEQSPEKLESNINTNNNDTPNVDNSLLSDCSPLCCISPEPNDVTSVSKNTSNPSVIDISDEYENGISKNINNIINSSNDETGNSIGKNILPIDELMESFRKSSFNDSQEFGANLSSLISLRKSLESRLNNSVE